MKEKSQGGTKVYNLKIENSCEKKIIEKNNTFPYSIEKF